MSDKTFLVTGAMGCIGAWTLYHLVQRGEKVVSFDLSTDTQRIDKILTADEKDHITFVQGDLTDTTQVKSTVAEHDVTHIIHLAALQVPFCRANPVLGAQVNVVGSINIFEAAREQGVNHIAYASSIAVYGAPEEYPPGLVAHDAHFAPGTLYGGYKVANELNAKVYFNDYGISSINLRPYTVYGVGRDQGLTSEPTKAILAAAKGEPYDISFGGVMQFQLASDVARQFIGIAETPLDGAYGFNLTGDSTSVRDFARFIREESGASITVTGADLPFPPGFDDTYLRQHLGHVYETPLREGIQQTLAHYKRLIAANAL